MQAKHHHIKEDYVVNGIRYVRFYCGMHGFTEVTGIDLPPSPPKETIEKGSPALHCKKCLRAKTKEKGEEYMRFFNYPTG